MRAIAVSARVSRIDLSGAERKAPLMAQAAQAATVMAAMRDSNPLVPYEMGALRGSAETQSQPEQGKLVYGSRAIPYAAPQYYGRPNKTWPGTTTRWFEHAADAHLAQWIEEGRRAAEEVAGR